MKLTATKTFSDTDKEYTIYLLLWHPIGNIYLLSNSLLIKLRPTQLLTHTNREV